MFLCVILLAVLVSMVLELIHYYNDKPQYLERLTRRLRTFVELKPIITHPATIFNPSQLIKKFNTPAITRLVIVKAPLVKIEILLSYRIIIIRYPQNNPPSRGEHPPLLQKVGVGQSP